MIARPASSLRRLRLAHAAAAALTLLLLSVPRLALAQLDPLLFLKRVPPTVIVVMDTSFRMLDDGTGNYYDPATYSYDTIGAALGVPNNTAYRRIYRGLQFEAEPGKYVATTITAVASSASTFAAFYDVTRLEIGKKGVRRAIDENPNGVRWGLVKLRQSAPAWRSGNNCDRPVRITGNNSIAGANDACAGGTIGVYAPSVTAANSSLSTGSGAVYAPSFTNSNSSTISTLLSRQVGDAGGLIPAGLDTTSYQDRPLAYALVDARAMAVSTVTADTTCRGCRNTVVVLVTGGKDDGTSTYRSSNNAASAAGTFASVTAGGTTKRVPIYVVAIKPNGDDESSLQQIATDSGGQYFNVRDADGVQRAVNLAVQAGYSKAADFNLSRASEYSPVSPIVGTVNLVGAETATGTTLPDSETNIQTSAGVDIPLRSNVMVTAGFAVGGEVNTPSAGFDGRLRAFRAFKPVPDSTKPSGYKFVKDGTPLWPDRDNRPETAGLARVPASPTERNIYTYVPGTGVIAFTTANAVTLQPHLGVSSSEARTLIDYVRGQPLGGIIGSTPALMDPPSIDPPPDTQYGRPETDGTYAGNHRGRRSMLFFGANDGMIHAVDARTGFEVWAFIPFNLLPKLRTIRDGQSVEQFDYFVDSSPKIAEVKVDGTWKSLLIIGESMGGTFLQAFDVTEAGMAGPDPESDDFNGVLSTFQDANRIRFLWSFPDYSSFDTTYTGAFGVTDGWPGGKVKFYGDVKSTASAAEKTVGFTWSDPAVGPLTSNRSINVVVVGSGYFPAITLPARTGDGVGRTLYLLNAKTGRPLGSPSSCSTAATGIGCLTVDDVSDGRKNALQADPTAAGVPNGNWITKAYLGDIDGNYWRFDVTSTGQITKTALLPSRNANQPIYSSSALMLVGSLSQFIFFSTGSDLLPTTTSGGAGPFTLYGILDQGSSAIIKFSRPLAVDSSRGIVNSIERPSTSPSVAGDIVFFTTTTESFSAPCTDLSSNLYAFTYQGGAAYDTDNSGAITKNESPVVRTMSGRATAPFVVDQHLYVSTTNNTGVNIEAFGDPEDFNNGVGQVGVRILSWRELR